MRSAVTISLVPEARGGPFVFWDDLESACARASKLGFDAVEIFPRSAADLEPSRVGGVLARHGLKLAAVGTGAGWVVHKLRFTDPDPATRRRAAGFVAEIIDAAGALGAPAIIGSMQGRWGDGISREQCLGWLGEAVEESAARAAGRGVPLLLEFLNRYETNLLNGVAQTVDFIESLKAGNARVLCDLFHMNIEETSIADALRLAGARLGHVHFADSNRQAVGFGHTSMEPVIAALRDVGYAGFLSAEILPVPDSDTAAAQTLKAFRTLTTSPSA